VKTTHWKHLSLKHHIFNVLKVIRSDTLIPKPTFVCNY